MLPADNASSQARPLSEDEARLLRWMLQNGKPEAIAFVSQLDHVRVLPWRCPCGCASRNFCLQGQPQPTGGMHLIADFVFGTDECLNGVFVYEQTGMLAGIEVYGLTGDAPKSLPVPEELPPLP